MQFPPSDLDYDEYNFSDIDLVIYGIHACSIFVIWFCVALLFFPEDTKRMSWSITLLNSLVCSVGSILYMWKKLPSEFFSFGTHKESIFHGRDNVSAMACLLFGIGNVVDLLIGIVFYRDRLQILSTFVHHPVFAFISFYAITGNFVGKQFNPFSQGLMWCLLEEIPTFILALGSVFPSFRMDLLFGISFFILRIVFHGYCTSYAILSKADIPILAFMSMSMIFHVIWFYQWVVGYRNRKKHVISAAVAPTGKKHTALPKAIRTTDTTSPLLAPPRNHIHAKNM
jgi:hypothetical protein